MLAVSVFLTGVPAYAQEKPEEKPQGKNYLEAVIDKVTRREETRDEKDDSAVIAEELADLPNPFLPQLPAEAVIKTPETPRAEVPGRLPQPRGPQLPDPQEPGPIHTFTLSGLIWNSDLPQAIVNGEVVSEGDRIDLWTVHKISRQGVELIYNDETMIIKP